MVLALALMSCGSSSSDELEIKGCTCAQGASYGASAQGLACFCTQFSCFQGSYDDYLSEVCAKPDTVWGLVSCADTLTVQAAPKAGTAAPTLTFDATSHELVGASLGTDAAQSCAPQQVFSGGTLATCQATPCRITGSANPEPTWPDCATALCP